MADKAGGGEFGRVGSGSDRGISPVIGTVLMVGVVVVLAAFVGVAVFVFGEDTEEPAPTVSLDTTFEATEEVDPHWQFRVTHESGDPIATGELLVRFVDTPRNNRAEVRYPGQFGAGDQFRAELWGDPSRVNGGNCLAGPEPSSNDQLDGFGTAGEFATSVDVLVIHEPSNTVLSEETFDLREEPERWTGPQRHYLVDGVTPSIDCPEEGDL